MYFQCYDPCGWDSYSPNGFQSPFGYGLSDQETNYFGKKEKEIYDLSSRDYFGIADPSSICMGRVYTKYNIMQCNTTQYNAMQCNEILV